MIVNLPYLRPRRAQISSCAADLGAASLDTVTLPYRCVTDSLIGSAISLKNKQVCDPASSVENVTVDHVSRDYLTEREVVSRDNLDENGGGNQSLKGRPVASL